MSANRKARIKQKYYSAQAGEWIYPVANQYRIACCDCGLVHLFDFRPISKSKIKMRAWRDNRATGQMRKKSLQPKATETAAKN